MNAATLLAFGVTILSAGWLWFYIARPILEAYGVIRVNDYEATAPVVMSRSEDSAALSRPLSPQTDSGQTDRPPLQTQPGRAELLTLYKTLREAGISREKVRPVLKAVGIPLDNNLWADAAPAEPDATAASYVTPIVGRATSARFETDPEFPYQAPAH